MQAARLRSRHLIAALRVQTHGGPQPASYAHTFVGHTRHPRASKPWRLRTQLNDDKLCILDKTRPAHGQRAVQDIGVVGALQFELKVTLGQRWIQRRAHDALDQCEVVGRHRV